MFWEWYDAAYGDYIGSTFDENDPAKRRVCTQNSWLFTTARES
jgi:hypothetical protein